LRLVVATLAFLLFHPVAFEAALLQSPSGMPDGEPELARVSEPPELKGVPTRPRVQPPAVDIQLVDSKALKANPEHPETIAPALHDINEAIRQAPERSDFYLLRATLSCFNGAQPSGVITDINKSIELYRRDHSAYEN